MNALPGTVVRPRISPYRCEVAVRNDDFTQFSGHPDSEQFMERLRGIVGSGLSITEDELFSCAICQDLGDLEGRRTRRELASRILGLKSFVNRDLPQTGDSLAFTGPPGKGVVEYLGVGTGIALLERLIDLDPSYFRRIDETPESKTLDFDGTFRAATVTSYVQLEVRGRTDGNNLEKAWSQVDAKKRRFRDGDAPPRPASAPLQTAAPTFLIGTIASIPLKRNGTTTITIGDPPIPAFVGDPMRARLLQRLRFYQRVLSVFQPRGALLTALSDRVATIENSDADWRRLDRQPLVNLRMVRWDLSSNIAHTIRIGPRDQLHGRSVFPARPRREATNPDFFFIGLHRDVLLALAGQEFTSIRDTRYERRYVKTEIDDFPRLLYQSASGLITSSVEGEMGELDAVA